VGRSQGEGQLPETRRDFADAATVFEDDGAITMADDDPTEPRYVTIGVDALARLPLVVYTMRKTVSGLFQRGGRPGVSEWI
jgi:uncharacterized protein